MIRIGIGWRKEIENEATEVICSWRRWVEEEPSIAHVVVASTMTL